MVSWGSVAAVAMLQLVAQAQHSTFPPPRWWEEAGANIRIVGPGCALVATSAPPHQLRGLPAFLALIDDLAASNVSTLQLRTAYDPGSGYDPADLFCGLAASNYSAVNPDIGGDAEWRTLIAAAHARNMTVMSSWNAGYVWTGSPYFKQAEADIRAHGLHDLPPDSPARWFRWRPAQTQCGHQKPPICGQQVRPADGQPHDMPSPLGWVWDPEVNASYFSVWGCQPAPDFASAEWRAEQGRILRRWFDDLLLDGIYFDAPDRYLGTSNGNDGMWNFTPALLRTSVTDGIRSLSSARAPAFAELYSDPPLADTYGFDGEYADNKLCPTHSARTCPPAPRSTAIVEGIMTANATMVESAMRG